MRGRLIAFLALAIPVCSGLGYLYAVDAPPSYVQVNVGALAVAALFVVFAPPSLPVLARRLIVAVSLALLFVPLLTGPSLGGVARWLPLGPVTLHAGMLIIPSLAVLLALEPEQAPGVLSLALLAALLQPDMASGAALMLAAIGLYDATKDWRYGVFAAVAFMASLVAAIHGELPAQPFVERVIVLLAKTQPLVAVGLLASLVTSFYLMIVALPGSVPQRKALAGTLFGFSFAGLVSNYPSALIGYGAAPILGYGLAIAILRMSRGAGVPSRGDKRCRPMDRREAG